MSEKYNIKVNLLFQFFGYSFLFKIQILMIIRVLNNNYYVFIIISNARLKSLNNNCNNYNFHSFVYTYNLHCNQRSTVVSH